jgi:hypothetical protein
MGVRKWAALLLSAAALAAGIAFLARRPDSKPPEGPSLDPVTDYDRVEAAQSGAGGFLKRELGARLLKRDAEAIRPALTADFRARFPDLKEGRRLDEDGLVIVDFAGAAVPETDASGFIQRLASLLHCYSTVERCVFRCYTFLLDRSEREARGLYHWWLTGRGPEGRRLEVQADLEIDYAGPPGAWKIRRLALPAGAFVESSRSPFADITDAAGFEFAYSAEGRKALQGAIDNRTMTNVGALAAVDWNRDGFPDLLATNENRRSVLFLNDGQGGFIPETLPEEGGLFYLYLDLDGDGVEELVSTQPKWYRGGKACLGLYVRRDGAWTFKESLVFDNPPTARELLYHHVAAGDADGDGRPDLLVSGYSSSVSGAEAFNFMDAKSGLRDLLFINRGGLQFSEEAEARGIRDTRYGYAAEFFDFDSDGDQDLLVINDFGPDNFYLNTGQGSFKEDPAHPIVQGPAFGMGLAISDFDNEGRYSVYVSNMYSHAGNRMLAVSPRLHDDVKKALLFGVQGNALFEPPGWKETAIPRGTARADWAWGCVFFDLDNDADKDLFVANGFTTHSDPSAPDY